VTSLRADDQAAWTAIRHLGRTEQATVIVVTHDERMIEGFDRVYHMTEVWNTDQGARGDQTYA
jgi:ABC-type lipoprotein export system ATPase subunit